MPIVQIDHILLIDHTLNMVIAQIAITSKLFPHKRSPQRNYPNLHSLIIHIGVILSLISYLP